MKMISFNLSKNTGPLMYVAGVLAALYLIYNFVVGPIILKFERLDKAIQMQEAKLKKNLEITGKKDAIDSEYTKHSDQLRQEKTDEEEVTSLLSNIESIAQGIPISITDMKPRAIKEMDFHKRLAVDIEVEAKMDEITEFIYNLQNEPYLLKIERLRIKSKSSRRRKTPSKLKGYLLVTKILIP